MKQFGWIKGIIQSLKKLVSGSYIRYDSIYIAFLK